MKKYLLAVVALIFATISYAQMTPCFVPTKVTTIGIDTVGDSTTIQANLYGVDTNYFKYKRKGKEIPLVNLGTIYFNVLTTNHMPSDIKKYILNYVQNYYPIISN